MLSSVIFLQQDRLSIFAFNSISVNMALLPHLENPIPIVKQQSNPTQNSVWVEISQNLKMDDHVDSPRVQKQIRQILANKAELNKSLQASVPYIYYIYSQIKSRHLPAELALIPIIESDYNPYDHNSIGANGLWQLMPATAKGLGVKITSSYDGRRSLVASTNAALNYFTDLNKEFDGNWYLAIAAYNCGDGGMSAAIRKAKSHDYWQLPLPTETKIYVPRLLAIAEIIKHPKKYGIQLPDVKNTANFSTIEVKQTTSLADYAKSNNLDLVSLQKLNPEYKTSKVTTKVSNILLIPSIAEKG